MLITDDIEHPIRTNHAESGRWENPNPSVIRKCEETCIVCPQTILLKKCHHRERNVPFNDNSRKSTINIKKKLKCLLLPSAGPAKAGSWDALSAIRVPLKLKLADLFRACDFT